MIDQREEHLKAEVSKKDNALRATKYLAETKSKQHASHVDELMTSLSTLKSARETTEMK